MCELCVVPSKYAVTVIDAGPDTRCAYNLLTIRSVASIAPPLGGVANHSIRATVAFKKLGLNSSRTSVSTPA
jgi:hypothetical protein